MTTIALPIETKVREFDGKLWLALNLIKRGYTVVLGRSDEIKSTLDITQPDIYVSKDPGDNNIPLFINLIEAGIRVCVLDTEGGVYRNKERYMFNKKESLNYVDKIFCWGHDSADAIIQHYGNSNCVEVTGNPRFDLLQPEIRSIYRDGATPLKEQYGKFILFNGNFPKANPFRQQVITKHEEEYGSMSQEKRIYNQRIFHLFLDAIYNLQNKFPETNVIIRPHPSEDNKRYEDIFNGYKHVHVEDSGDVRYWLAGASVTLHHDCTTGIESALMGVPVVSYRPVQNRKYESELPQIVSEQVFTLNELTTFVSQHLQKDQSYELDTSQTDYLKQFFHNIDESAAENICNVIDSLEIRSEKNYDKLKPDLKGDIERRLKSSRWSDQVLAAYDDVHNLVGKKSRREQRQYNRQKFPGLKKGEVYERIEHIGKVLDIGLVSVESVTLTNDTFYLRPEKPYSNT